MLLLPGITLHRGHRLVVVLVVVVLLLLVHGKQQAVQVFAPLHLEVSC